MSRGMTGEQQITQPNDAPNRGANGASAASLARDERASILADLEAEAAADEEAPAEGGQAADAETRDVDAAGSDAAKSGSERASAKETVDAETAKRLAAVQKAEQRSRDKLAVERKDLEDAREKLKQEQAEMAAVRKEMAAFTKIKERAAIDPVAALEALGVTDYEHAARQAYARHKGDPGNKEAAARSMRERERDDDVSTLKRRLDDYEKRDQEREQNATIQREAAAFMDGAVKAASTGKYVDDAGREQVLDAPLAKHFMAKSPAKTRGRLAQIAVELLNETGDRPDYADVLARFEQTRRAELEDYGVNIDSILKTEPQKKNEPAADKKNSARTLSNDLTTPRVPRSRSDERAERAEILAALESGKLD
jgi:hypothetical protein